MFIPNFRISCIIFLLLATTGARTQDLISARVLSSEGPIEIRRQPDGQPQIQKIALKVNEELRAGDCIITGRGGRLVLGLSDGSQAVIAPQTTVVIQELRGSPRTLFQVLRGKTRVQIEKLGGQPNPYRVNTPTAVIAVRGTIFDVLVKNDETEVFLHEGEVAVTNLTLPDQPVLLSAGQRTRVIQMRLPNRPDTFKPGRNDDAFRMDKRMQENRQIADRKTNPDSGRSARDGRDVGRPDSRSGSGRGDAQSGAARPNQSSRGGGRRP